MFHGDFWYVIYEHETVKDKDCGNEITRSRYEFMVSLNDSKAKDPPQLRFTDEKQSQFP